EAGPEVFVLFAAFEIRGDPVPEPSLFHGFDDILAVRVDRDLQSIFFQGFETGDDGHQFHAVIGRATEAPGQLFTLITPEQNSAIAAGARIAARGAVRVHDQFIAHAANILYLYHTGFEIGEIVVVGGGLQSFRDDASGICGVDDGVHP